MLAWDDYRLILAVARAGGLSGAAERLGVTLPTVFRRLGRIEDSLGMRLFDRLRGGYQPTYAGRELARAAERMEQEALAGDRAVTGRDQQLVGNLRVTATEVLATYFVAQHVAAFRALHPGLSVEISADNRRFSIADREADIALRPQRPEEKALVGRKVATLRWGIYASPTASQRLGPVHTVTQLAGNEFVGWVSNHGTDEVTAWLERAVPGGEVKFRSTSLITNAALAATNVALAPLPCLLGSVWPGLEPILVPLPDVSGELWIVTHQDLRRNARVRAFIEHVTAAAKTNRDLFEGTLAGSA